MNDVAKKPIRKNLAVAAPYSVLQDVAELDQALVAARDGDVRGVQQLRADEEHGDHEDAGGDVGDPVVQAHDLHPAGVGPALGVDPVAVRGQRDRAADAADQAQGVEDRVLLVGQDREEAGEGVGQVRGDADRQVDGDHEHDAHQDRHDLLEDRVPVEPDEDQADQTAGDGPPLEVHARPGTAPAAAARWTTSPPRRRRSPRSRRTRRRTSGPAAEARPAVEQGAAGGQMPAARRLGEGDLDEAADDRRPTGGCSRSCCPR